MPILGNTRCLVSQVQPRPRTSARLITPEYPSLQNYGSSPSTVLVHSFMEPDPITQIKQLLAAAGDLREKLSNADRLQLIGLTDSLSNELQRPDEAVFRITFNQVCLA